MAAAVVSGNFFLGVLPIPGKTFHERDERIERGPSRKDRPLGAAAKVFEDK